MPFDYYQRLSERDRAIYDRSDRVIAVPLPHAPSLRPIVRVLEEGLRRDERPVVQQAASRLALGITQMLEIEPVDAVVLAVRPARTWGELHGLYTRDAHSRPRIRVWMRTAHHRRVVAFRTFVRTLLHEVCHHLDYTLLRLADSFHTEGFFKRESSLFYQLVPREDAAAAPRSSRGQKLPSRRRDQ